MEQQEPRRNLLRLLTLGGVAGPLLFSGVTVIGGALRPGYDPVSQFISELGETGAELAWLMNTFGFMLSAALIGLFVIALFMRSKRTPATVIGSLLLAAFAVSVFLAGIWSCDLGCSPVDPTPDQQLHDLVSVIAFPAFTLGVALWGAHFLRDARSRRFGAYSLASAALSVMLLVLMVQSEATREWTGVYQRLFLGVLFLWMIMLALRLQRDGRS